MASQPPSVAEANNNANSRPAAKPRVPPEEQFWERYSPHHEAPLSGIGSFAMHFLIIGFLVVAGYLGWLGLGSHRSALPNDVVQIDAGGGGRTNGQADNPANGGGSPEVADQKPEENPSPLDTTKTERKDLKDPGVASEVLPQAPSDDAAKRIIKDADESLGSLAQFNKDSSKVLEGLKSPGAGKGGPGKGGGKGAGNGPGEGDGRSAGIGGTPDQRERRMSRWTMVLNSGDGFAYLRELRGLGAILAIPKDRDGRDFWIIRDLSSTPAKLEDDVSLLGDRRLEWRDRKPESVTLLARALGLRQRPEFISAYMPQELEDKLLEEELKAQKLTEDEILETYFKVRVGRDGKYYPMVIRQIKK
jgi:hypothetical protein